MRSYTRFALAPLALVVGASALIGADARGTQTSTSRTAPPRTIELREDGSPFIALNIWVIWALTRPGALRHA